METLKLEREDFIYNKKKQTNKQFFLFFLFFVLKYCERERERERENILEGDFQLVDSCWLVLMVLHFYVREREMEVLVKYIYIYIFFLSSK